MGLFSFFKKKKKKEAEEADNIQEEIRQETAEISQEAGEVSQAVEEQQPEKETVEVLQSDSESNHAADEKPQSDAAIIQAEEEKRRVEEQRRQAEEERRLAEEERRLAEEERRQAEEEKKGLEKSLKKTKEGVFGRLARAIAGKSKVDDDVLDKLEEALILSDVGPNTTIQIIERIEKRVATDKYMNTSELNRILKEEVASMLAENKGSDSGYFEAPENGDPYVIMVVGVNGVGKTT
ncbi:MAG: signal recognition particle receptor subunit alpha, partial [Bacteroidales bacterium]|nr:signal recognition particle receptor subunit alpha [Bacteroidales bacterium]